MYYPPGYQTTLMSRLECVYNCMLQLNFCFFVCLVLCLNGAKCLQLAHDCAHVIFPQTLKIQYGGPQAINSMRMSGSSLWYFAPIKSVPL